MKNLFILLLLTLSFKSYSDDLLTKVKETSTQVVDSTKQKLKESTTFVDTSSNFKLIYSDLKSGLTALSQSLKVGAEHVYTVLVKQQLVNSIVIVLIGFIPLLLLLVFGKNVWKWAKREREYSDGFSVFIAVLFFCFTIAPTMYFIFSLDTVVMGFINPEYGAIMDIINFVKDQN